MSNGGSVAEKIKAKTGIEEEQALIIRSEDPDLVIADIAAQKKIGGWLILEKQEDQNIQDAYLNTKFRDFNSSLRIRNVNGEDFITFKTKNKSSSGSSIRRETEVKWPWDSPSAWDLVELFGLEVVQERRTHRIVRLIYNLSHKLLAELALDTVTYLFEEEEATFHEAEIEMKTKDSAVKLASIVDIFTKKYPELEIWEKSKFATGTVLDIALGIKTDEDGTLTEDSIDNLSLLLGLVGV